jgi:O-antigen ligase
VIALGIQGAQGLMVSTYLLLKGRLGWHRGLALCLLPLSLVALLASGSRGPVLGGTAGLLAVLVLLSRSRQTIVRILVVGVFLAFSFTVAIKLVPSAASQRSISTITGTRSGLASNGRDQLWSAGWNTFTAHPLLGVGTGSFATVARRDVCPGPGCRDKYPHNVLLETAAELGVGGLLAMIVVLVSAGGLILRAWRRGGREGDQAAIVFGLFVSATVTAMLTGDLTGDETIWLAGGIALGLALRHESAARA